MSVISIEEAKVAASAVAMTNLSATVPPVIVSTPKPPVMVVAPVEAAALITSSPLPPVIPVIATPPLMSNHLLHLFPQ